MTFGISSPKQLSDQNSQGLQVGASATDKVGFFGATPVAQNGTPSGNVATNGSPPAAAAAAAITVGASPYAYTNSSGITQEVTVTGGTVSAITVTRGAFTSASLGTTGQFTLAPSDVLNVTYSALPAMESFNAVPTLAFTGGSGTSAYTTGDIVAALKANGLLKS